MNSNYKKAIKQKFGGGAKKAIFGLLALVVTLVALGMAAVAGIDRGGSEYEQILIGAGSIVICVGSQTILAINRGTFAKIVWAICLMLTVYSHVSFLKYSWEKAGNNRVMHSIQVDSIQIERKTLEKTIAGIHARPISDLAIELANAHGKKMLRALEAEYKQAQRAVDLQDKLVALDHKSSETLSSTTSELVATSVAKFVLVSPEIVSTIIALEFSLSLELLGAFFWIQSIGKNSEEVELEEITADLTDDTGVVRRAIAAGFIKYTVRDIRSFLECGQIRAARIKNLLAEEEKRREKEHVK